MHCDGALSDLISFLRHGLSSLPVIAIRYRPPFDGGSFLVVVPGLNQQERNRRRTIVVTPVEIEGVVEGLSTPALHVAVEAPLFAGIIEARPSPSHYHFVWILFLHRLLEIIHVLLPPVTSRGGPSTPSPPHP